MDRRPRGDVTLNARLNDAPDADEVLERLVDPSPCHDIKLAEDDELAQRRTALKAAIQTLSARERHIFTERYLSEDPPKLEKLAVKYGISRERIRQIELRAFQKVKSAMQGDCQKPRAANEPAESITSPDRRADGLRL